MDDFVYMDEALALAAQAAAEGEVPVGCVIVRGDQIVGRGRNRRETAKTALGHAEIEAIDEACRTLGGWRLWECTLYVPAESIEQYKVADQWMEFFFIEQSGIEDMVVDADSMDAPVEYFNLQGIRVANPENGLYIRRQGNKAAKVYVK